MGSTSSLYMTTIIVEQTWVSPAFLLQHPTTFLSPGADAPLRLDGRRAPARACKAPPSCSPSTARAPPHLLATALGAVDGFADTSATAANNTSWLLTAPPTHPTPLHPTTHLHTPPHTCTPFLPGRRANTAFKFLQARCGALYAGNARRTFWTLNTRGHHRQTARTLPLRTAHGHRFHYHFLSHAHYTHFSIGALAHRPFSTRHMA